MTDNIKSLVSKSPLVVNIGGNEVAIKTELNTFQVIELAGLLSQGALKSIRYKMTIKDDKAVPVEDVDGNWVIDSYATAMAFLSENASESQQAIVLLFTKFKVNKNTRNLERVIDFEDWDALTIDIMIDIIARVISDNDWGAIIKKITAVIEANKSV